MGQSGRHDRMKQISRDLGHVNNNHPRVLWRRGKPGRLLKKNTGRLVEHCLSLQVGQNIAVGWLCVAYISRFP